MDTEPDVPIIELRDVRRSFDGLDVLRGVDLAVRRGSTTVVIGPSGCGKSVLLKHIVGLLKPDSGSIFFDGREITRLGERDLVDVRKRIGLVFQGGALFDSMNVEQNICFPLIEHGICSLDECRDRCHEALRSVGLDGMQGKMPEKLSGGQRKRVALARAIVIHPDVILYDEPTTGLDPVRADLINELITRLQQRLQTTAVVVTHDIASARKVGDRIAMLYEGRFIADASPTGIFDIDDDRVRRFVEGRASAEELGELQIDHLAGTNHRSGTVEMPAPEPDRA
jgi:phospholipid/cholesterol/gamma-HCH transport system ATP-binding protein